MTKAINNFIVSLALVLFSLFGLSACAGPLDNLKVSVSTSERIEQTDDGYQTTLNVGEELNIEAVVDGAGGNVSSRVLWQSYDLDKVEVTNVKYAGDTNYATIKAKNVTTQGSPVKIRVSSIEKTSAYVDVFVNVIAEATTVIERNNTAVAEKGTVYVPNVLDFFTFTDDSGSTNVTVPDYSYTITATVPSDDGENTIQKVLDNNEIIPNDAQSIDVTFTPTASNVFSSEVYKQQLTISSVKEEETKAYIILYESLSDTTFGMQQVEIATGETTDIDKLELVLNKDNGQNYYYILKNFNPDTMKVSYTVSPAKYANCVSIEQSTQDKRKFSFFGQEETSNDDVSIQFNISYEDFSLTSKGVFTIPLNVVSYPDTIAINGDTGTAEYNLTVYNNYVTRGEVLSIAISPYSDVYKDIKIYATDKNNNLINNLEWYTTDSTDLFRVDDSGIIISSGTRLYLKNGMNSLGQYESGTITYSVVVDGTGVERTINIQLGFGIDSISAKSSDLDSSTGDFVLAINEDAKEDSNISNANGEHPTSDARSIRLCVNDTADPTPLLDAYEVSDPTIVRVFTTSVVSVDGANCAEFVLQPIKAGTTTIVWTAPTGVSYVRTVFVFNELYEYSLGLYGQSDIVGEINYQLSQDEATNELDKNDLPLLASIKVATNSAINFVNVLTAQNAYVNKIEYSTSNQNVVKYVGSVLGNLTSMQLRTGDTKGSATVTCIVTYYTLSGSNLATTTKNISFTVNTYNKVTSIHLSDANITLYAPASDDKTGYASYVYNQQYSQKIVTIYADTNGGYPDVFTENAIWSFVGTSANFGDLNIESSITPPSSTSSTGDNKKYYGSYITIKAVKFDPSKQTSESFTMQVTLKDYNTTLSATLRITVTSFEKITGVTYNTTSKSDSLRVTQNIQSGENSNRMIELYTEVSYDGVIDAYFTLLPTVRPTRAINKNLEYVIFDYDNEGKLLTRTDTTDASYYISQHTSRLVSIVLNSNTNAYEIKLNSDTVTNKDENGNVTGSTTTVRSGRAVVYVLAQNFMTKTASTIDSLEAIDDDAIMFRIEIVVADGTSEAYRIYNAKDYLHIYTQKDKSFVVMNDIYNVDLSGAVNEQSVTDYSFGGTLSTATYTEATTDKNDNVETVTKTPTRTIYFKDINYNKSSKLSLFGDLTGSVSNLTFYIPSYTLTSTTTTTAIDTANIGVLANTNKGTLDNVGLTIGTLKFTDTTGAHGGTQVYFGAIAENYAEGDIKGLNVYIGTANYEITDHVSLTFGVGVNNGTISGLTTAGVANITTKEGVTPTSINFAGAIVQNNKIAKTNEDGTTETVYGVSDTESSVNLDSSIALDIVGGTVGFNTGDMYDVRYLSVNDNRTSADSTHGLKVTTVTTLGGVVGTNSGIITYAYAVGFVSDGGINVTSATNLGGVVGDNTNGTLDKVFSSINITGTATDFNAIANNGTITDYYTTSNNAYSTSYKLGDENKENLIWGVNFAYTNAYPIKDSEGNTITYAYLIKDKNPYLPSVPASLNCEQYLIMEYTGATANEYNYNRVVVTLNTKTDENEKTTYTGTGSGTITTMSSGNQTFQMFSTEGTEGLFNLTCPPVKLADLRIFVTNSDNGVVNIIEGVKADSYKIKIVGNGTTILTITSALNLNATTTVQICVLNGYATFKLLDNDTSAEIDKINLKKGVAQEFVVEFDDVSGQAISGSELLSNFEATSSDSSKLVITEQSDSIVLTGQETSTTTLNVTKTWTAKFYDLSDKDNLAIKNYIINNSEGKTYNVSITTGPTAISINHGDQEVYAGEYVYTIVTVTTDDGFTGDELDVIIDKEKHTITVENGTATVSSPSNAVWQIEAVFISNNSTATFTLKYKLKEPTKLTQGTNYTVIFTAKPSSSTTTAETSTITTKLDEQAKNGVSTSYNLFVEPQPVTSLDFYHYIDVIETSETGELTQAGRTPSTTFVSGGFGLLKVSLFPEVANFDHVVVSADLQNNGSGVVFDERLLSTDGNKYTLHTNSDIEITNNSITVSQSSLPDQFSTSGMLYFRTYLPANIDATTVFNVTVTVYGADGQVQITKTKRYSVYSPNALALRYDNYVGEQSTAYIALNTGGIEEGDTYGQNTNIITATVQAGLINPTIQVTGNNTAGVTLLNYGSTGTIGESSYKLASQETTTQVQQYKFYVIVRKDEEGNSAKLGNTFTIRLTAQTYVSGVLTTIAREMNFKVVDFVINYQWNNVANSEILSNAFESVEGAISNVTLNTWNYVFSQTPIQLSLFVSDVRNNRNLLDLDDVNETNLGDTIAGLRNIPEFSYDATDATDNKTLIEKIVKYLKVLNRNGYTYTTEGSDSVTPFLYEQDGGYKSWTNTTLNNHVKLQIGKDDKDTIKSYYITGMESDANESLQASMYLSYGSDTNNNGQFKISATHKDGDLHYNYNFSIAYNSLNSDEHPIPIYTVDDLKSMSAGYAYILMNDIELSENFSPINTAIASLDGNNYTIKLNTNKPFNTTDTSGNLGLFGVVSADTILKNITISISSDTTLDCTTVDGDTQTSFVIGLLAGQNSGTITNCKITSQSSTTNNETTYRTFTLTSSPQKNESVVFGGLVGQNNGYITNCNTDGINFKTSYVIFGGLVAQNNSLITACYVNNSVITNTVLFDVDGATVLGGLVAQNSGGTIAESYVGDANVTLGNGEIKNVQHTVTIKSNSRFGGLVYSNDGDITDSYTAIALNNQQTAIASGFAYENSGTISRAYSVSRPTNSTNTFIRPFIGTTDTTGVRVLNNTGTLSYCLYYSAFFSDYQKSAELASGVGLDTFTTQNKVDEWVGFAFASTEKEDNGVWKPLTTNTFGPKLINANIPGMKAGVHQALDRIESSSAGAVYYYVLGGSVSNDDAFNTKACVDLIDSASDFNKIFEQTTTGAVTGSDPNYYARIIRPIDLSTLLANNLNLNTTNKIFRGTLIGNNMDIAGIDVSYLDIDQSTSDASVVLPEDEYNSLTAESNTTKSSIQTSQQGSDVQSQGESGTQTDSSKNSQKVTLATQSTNAMGLFGEIRDGTVANLNLTIDSVYANNSARCFVGGLAGRVINGTIYNLSVQSTSQTSSVLGRYIVGGVVGLVQGKSHVTNITSNISVTSDFDYTDTKDLTHLYNYDMWRLHNKENNSLDMTPNGARQLSIAGGLFGVLDLFSDTSSNLYTIENTPLYNSTSLTFEGDNTVLGQVAGGVVGMVGSLTVLNDAHTAVSNNMRIKASVYGGGLVGQNNGTIKYSDVKYLTAVQTLVNTANTGATIDSANSKLFDSISYSSAVGGLVGANFGENHTTAQTGVIRYCSTSIYVDAPNAQNVGGLVGIVFGGDIRAVYATGYVLGHTRGNVGGLIGTVSEIKSNDEINISPNANIPDNLLVQVANPYHKLSVLLHTLLLDFVVAQNNWSSANLDTYKNIQKYGHIGGLVGYTTNKALLTSSHKGTHYNQQGYTAKQTVAINYFVNQIPSAVISTNSKSYPSGSLSINAYYYNIDNTGDTSEDTKAVDNIATGDTRNAGYNCASTWDWYALWDTSSIVGRNADSTPILQKISPNIDTNIDSVEDFLTVYWHPNENYTLGADIYFKDETTGTQIDYIMVGTKNMPFSGTFNGQGHTIYYLNVSNSLANMGGLFGYVKGTGDNKASIHDLILSDATVSNFTSDIINNSTYDIINNSQFESIGGLSGTIDNATINNVVINGLNLNVMVQNNSKGYNHYVGGLAGLASNNVNVSNVSVEAIKDKKIDIKQTTQSDTSTSTLDTLYVGGMFGKATNVNINDATDDSWMSISNVNITNTNVYNKTYFGSLVGYASVINTNKTIIAGEVQFDGEFNSTALYVGGFYGYIDNKNDESVLQSSYGYSTIKLNKFTKVSDTNNIHLAYDFNYPGDTNDDTSNTPVKISNVIMSPSDLEQEGLNYYNADTTDTDKKNAIIQSGGYKKVFEDAYYKKYLATNKEFVFNATTIVNNLGVQSNLDISRYVYKKDVNSSMTLEYTRITTDGETSCTDTVTVRGDSCIPLDPYYSLVTKDEYYDTRLDDLTIAQNFYPNLLAFTNDESTNAFGYKQRTDSTKYLDENKLKDALNNIGKLYYTSEDNYTNTTTVGGAVVLGSISSNLNTDASIGTYYILTSDKVSRVTISNTNENLFINGHNHIVKLTNTTSLIDDLSGVITGVQVLVVSNNVASITTYKTPIGLVANTQTSTGALYACGSYITRTINSDKLEYAELNLSSTTSTTFGGVVGKAQGIVNNCWSHIMLNISGGSDPSTNTSGDIVGGIVGEAAGATLANLNFYGDLCIISNGGTTAGIVGNTTSTSTFYKALSFVQSAPTYHIARDEKTLNDKVYLNVIGNSAESPTMLYFNYKKDEGGIGYNVSLSSVLTNIDVKTLSASRNASGTGEQSSSSNTSGTNEQGSEDSKANKGRLFEAYYSSSIWQAEQEGYNFDMARLAVEPAVKSTTGISADDPIEVPDEQTFAEMLNYESNQINSYCRYYILTKEDTTNGTDSTGATYDLDEIAKNVASLLSGVEVINLTTVNGVINDSTHNYYNTYKNRVFTGHLMGNNKTLEWVKGSTPIPLFSKIMTGEHNGDLLDAKTDVAYPAYVIDLTIVNNSGNGVANILANEVDGTKPSKSQNKTKLAPYIRNVTYKNSDCSLTITTSTGLIDSNLQQHYIGGLVGKNAGEISNCKVKGLNFNISKEMTAYIGGLVGENYSASNNSNSIENSGLIKDIIINNSKISYSGTAPVETFSIGGVAGVNSGMITSSNNDKAYTIDEHTLIKATTDDTQIVLSDTTGVTVYGTTPTEPDSTSITLKAGEYITSKNEITFLMLSGTFESYDLWDVKSGESVEMNSKEGELLQVTSSGISNVTTSEEPYSPGKDVKIAILSGTFSLNTTKAQDTGGDAIIHFSDGAKYKFDNQSEEITVDYDETDSDGYVYFTSNQLSTLTLVEGNVSIYKTTKVEHHLWPGKKMTFKVRTNNDFPATNLLLLYVERYPTDTGTVHSVMIKSGEQIELDDISSGKLSKDCYKVTIEIAVISLDTGKKGRIEDVTPTSRDSVSESKYNTVNPQTFSAFTQKSANIVSENKTTSNYINMEFGTSYVDYVGGVVGQNKTTGQITSYTLQNANVNGYDYVGGIAGCNEGTISSSTIKDVTVKGHDYVGGIAGQNTHRLATVTVSGGSVTGTDDFVGGITGSNQNGQYNTAVIDRFDLYTVTINGDNANTAAVAGYNNGTITLKSNTYARISEVTLNISLPSDENKTSDLKPTQFYAGFVTPQNWGDIDIMGNLAVINGSKISLDICKCTGGESNGQQSVYIGTVAGSNENIFTNINVSAIRDYSTGSLAIIESSLQFELERSKEIIGYIGGVVGENRGSLRGVGKIAVNMDSKKINDENSVNLNLTNIDTIYVGGVAGDNVGYISGKGGSNSKVSSSINIDKANYVGGIAGQNAEKGAICNISFNGDINVTTLIQKKDGEQLEYDNANVPAIAYGPISIDGGIGGITAKNAGIIFLASYRGDITASADQIGGIAGRNKESGVIASCKVSSGSITGQDYIGGLVGYNEGQLSNSTQLNNTEKSLNENHVYYANDATISTNTAVGIKTYGTKFSANGVTIGINSGKTIQVFVPAGTVQTINKSIQVTLLTPAGIDGIDGVLKSGYTFNKKNDTENIREGFLTYSTNALVEITNNNNALAVDVTFSEGSGDIIFTTMEDTMTFKSSNPSSVNMNGLFRSNVNTSQGQGLTIGKGSIYSLSAEESTSSTESEYNKFELTGTATYTSDNYTTVSVNGTQTYQVDTTSEIEGSVTHKADTKVTMGTTTTKTETDDKGNETTITTPVYTTEKITSGTTIKYAEGTILTLTDLPHETKLIGEVYTGVSLTFGYKSTVIYGGGVDTTNTNITEYTIKMDGKDEEPTKVTVNNTTTETTVNNETHIYRSTYIKGTTTTKDENGNETTTSYAGDMGSVCFKIGSTGATITYNADVTVSVYGTQTYQADTTSEIEGSVTHKADTKVTMGTTTTKTTTDADGNETTITTPVDYTTEQYTTANAQIEYEDATVTLSNSDASLKFAGTQKFLSTCYASVDGVLYYDETSLIDIKTIKKYTITYKNNEIIKIEDYSLENGANLTPTETASNDEGTKYYYVYKFVKGITVLGEFTITADTTLSNQKVKVTKGTQVTYGDGATETYSADTVSKIIGTVTYSDESRVTYDWDSTKQTYVIYASNKTVTSVTYNDDGTVAYKGGTSVSYMSKNNALVSITFTSATNITVDEKVTNVNDTTSNIDISKNKTLAVVAGTTLTFTYQNNGQNNGFTLTYKDDATVSYDDDDGYTSHADGVNVQFNNGATETYKDEAIVTYSGTITNVIDGSVITLNSHTLTVQGKDLFAGLDGNIQDTDLSSYGNDLTITGGEYIGGAIGYNASTATVNSVDIQSVSIVGTRYIGGFVGMTCGDIILYEYYEQSSSEKVNEIANCSVHNVTIGNDQHKNATIVGGFAGIALYTKLTNCGVTGKITIEAGYTIGGFVGQTSLGHNKNNYESKSKTKLDHCYMHDITDGSKITSNKTNPNANNPSCMSYYEGSGDWINAIATLVNSGAQDNDQRNLDKVVGHAPGGINKNNCDFSSASAIETSNK